MRIGKPRIKHKGEHTYLMATIEDEILNKTTETFFSVQKEYGDYFVFENADAFALAMLWPATISGQDIYVEGAISDYAYLNYPKLLYLISKANNRPQVRLYANEVCSFEFNPTAVATGFSGGVDSFTTFINHTKEECPERFKLTHLALFNVSAYGLTYESTNEEYINDSKRAQEFASKVNMPIVLINSNIFNICADQKLGACAWFISNNIGSAVTSMSKLFKTYFVSSSIKVEDTKIWAKDQGYYENISYPLISNNNTSIYVAEPDMSRLEKTKFISQASITYDELCVCLASIANELYDLGFERKGYRNCGECRKCIRTLLTLDALGVINNYSSVFNLSKYNQIKDRLIKELQEDTGDVLRLEVLELLGIGQFEKH